MGTLSALSGQEPGAEAGAAGGNAAFRATTTQASTTSHSSFTAATSRSRKVRDRASSSTNPDAAGSAASVSSSSNPVSLSEEQLQHLPPIFRRKTHQQCLEMDPNRFIPPEHAGRGRQLLAVMKADFFGLRLVFQPILDAVVALGCIMLKGLKWGLTYVIAALIFAYYRHSSLVRMRSVDQEELLSFAGSELRFKFPLFIMGSGGHTAEMISMIEHSLEPVPGMFRRYVVNEDDVMSRTRIIDLEERIAARFLAAGVDPGLFDIQEVQRARRVHQSWISTPVTVFQSFLSIVGIILGFGSSASTDGGETRSDWRYPGAVISNGPGTCFVFLFAIHCMKMLYMVPQHRMRTVYVESFAKVHKLSMTGLLIHHTNLADVFIVQHQPLADHYGKTLAMNFSVTPASQSVVASSGS